MYFRLLLLIPSTILALLMAITSSHYRNEWPVAYGLATLVGFYGIWYVLWYEIRFKLTEGFLIIDAPLRPTERLNMEDLTVWKTYGHNIRSQRRETLLLFFAQPKKVAVDNSRCKKEFDELLAYVKSTHSLKQSDAVI